MTELSRVEAVRLLLESRDLWAVDAVGEEDEPQLKRSAAYRGRAVGEAATQAKECPRCQGNGRLRSRAGEQPCDRCAGSGRLRIDAYTEKEVAAGVAPFSVEDIRRTLRAERDDHMARERRMREVLSQLEREAAWREDEVAESERMGFEREKRRWWSKGSYAELEHAERVLRKFDFVSWAAVVTAYGPEAELRVVTVSLRRRAERGLDLLARLMPETIRVPAWLMPKGATSVAGRGRWANGAAQERRNEEVRRLRAEGLSLAEIGRRCGLDRSTVCRILGKENGEEAA